jgi:hypothetical protein
MSGSNEGIGLFRRMARKVASPARDSASGNSASAASESDARPTEFDKAEMKAMIERKRRNDYVRKRELDMLRRIRREGLSGEQAAALTLQSSRLDEVEARSTGSSPQAGGIKAKIDAIERQMVGASAGVSAGGAARVSRPAPLLPPGPPPPILTTTIFDVDDASPTLPASSVQAPPAGEQEAAPRVDAGPTSRGVPLEFTVERPRPLAPDTIPPTMPAALFDRPEVAELSEFPLDLEAIESPAAAPAAAPVPVQPAPAPTPARATAAAPAPAPVVAPAARAPVAPSAPQTSIDLGMGERVEVSHAMHDEGLDESVIAFASGDFQGCERSLQALIAPRGERRDHDETWLVMFDLYRAIGQQAKFETLTMEYVEHFHRSAPQWFSLPKLLADATATPASESHDDASVGWVCPATLDGEAVNRLEALSMQLPLPWVMDWSALTSIDVEGAGRLQKLFSGWASQALTMRWIGGDQLLAVLQELAPTGVRDVDPVYWMLRLEALRLAHRPDQFDEVAIDYCVTFEVSPPSWENARCKAQLTGSGPSAATRPLSMSVVGEPVTSYLDGAEEEETAAPAPMQITSVELSGQLSGDIGPILDRLADRAGESRLIRISCALLMRVDFVAAGDLLNWVSARHAEGREIVFQETHRLVALMFGAMGINESARVQLRTH